METNFIIYIINIKTFELIILMFLMNVGKPRKMWENIDKVFCWYHIKMTINLCNIHLIQIRQQDNTILYLPDILLISGQCYNHLVQRWSNLKGAIKNQKIIILNTQFFCTLPCNIWHVMANMTQGKDLFYIFYFWTLMQLWQVVISLEHMCDKDSILLFYSNQAN